MRTEKAARYFDEIASDYNQVRGTEIFPSLIETLRSVSSDGHEVLDVATGRVFLASR